MNPHVILALSLIFEIAPVQEDVCLYYQKNQKSDDLVLMDSIEQAEESLFLLSFTDSSTSVYDD
jgi:hypothetical protein